MGALFEPNICEGRPSLLSVGKSKAFNGWGNIRQPMTRRLAHSGCRQSRHISSLNVNGTQTVQTKPEPSLCPKNVKDGFLKFLIWDAGHGLSNYDSARVVVVPDPDLSRDLILDIWLAQMKKVNHIMIEYSIINIIPLLRCSYLFTRKYPMLPRGALRQKAIIASTKIVIYIMRLCDAMRGPLVIEGAIFIYFLLYWFHLYYI